MNANDVINRVRNLKEFTVVTDCTENFRFNGVVPFDMNVTAGVLAATVLAESFDEAAALLDAWLHGQSN